MLAATLVAPGHDKVVPLEPEFIVPQDGAEKQDCENRAAKRWLAAHAKRYAPLDPVYLGDDLFSRQPLCQAVKDASGHFIFVCKPSSHPLIQEYLSGIGPPMLEQTVKRGKQRFVHRYRWLANVPLRDGNDALTVNWFEIEIINPKGETTYRNSFVTDLPVDPDTVVELAACGRARWKIENETFSPTSRIRRGFWDFCVSPVAQAFDLTRNPFLKVARISCSEDLASSRGQDFVYWSAPAGSFCAGMGSDRSKILISGNLRRWNNCHACSEDFFVHLIEKQ